MDYNKYVPKEIHSKTHYNQIVKSKAEIWKNQEKCDLSHTKGIIIRLSADSSAEILQARREYHNLFKSLKEKNLSTMNTISGKTFF